MINLYLNRREASAYLLEKYGSPGSITATTLAKLAVTGCGPKFVRFGRKVAYTPEALDAFVQSRLSPEMQATRADHVINV